MTDQLFVSFDPGWANLGIVTLAWGPRARRVTSYKTVKTKPEQLYEVRTSELARAIDNAVQFAARHSATVVCEDMCNVRAGKNAKGHSNSNDDQLIKVQGAIEALCAAYGVPCLLIRSQSSYAAVGATLPPGHGEDSYQRSQRQKAATRSAVCRIVSAAETLTEHEIDACAHAIGAALGKFVRHDETKAKQCVTLRKAARR